MISFLLYFPVPWVVLSAGNPQKLEKNRLKQLGKLFENSSFFKICIYGHTRRFGAHNFTSNWDKVVKQKRGCFLHSRQLKNGTIQKFEDIRDVTDQVRCETILFSIKITHKIAGKRWQCFIWTIHQWDKCHQEHRTHCYMN